MMTEKRKENDRLERRSMTEKGNGNDKRRNLKRICRYIHIVYTNTNEHYKSITKKRERKEEKHTQEENV